MKTRNITIVATRAFRTISIAVPVLFLLMIACETTQQGSPTTDTGGNAKENAAKELYKLVLRQYDQESYLKGLSQEQIDLLVKYVTGNPDPDVSWRSLTNNLIYSEAERRQNATLQEAKDSAIRQKDAKGYAAYQKIQELPKSRNLVEYLKTVDDETRDQLLDYISNIAIWSDEKAGIESAVETARKELADEERARIERKEAEEAESEKKQADAEQHQKQLNFLELAANGTPEEVQQVITSGIDVNASGEEGVTALMCAAAENPNPDVSRILLEAGATIEARDSEGETALIRAAHFSKNSEVISQLIKAGADVTAKDVYGKTAFDYAQNNEKLRDTNAYSRLAAETKKSALAVRKEEEQIEKERAGREQGFEGFLWGTHIRDVAREYDALVQHGGIAPLKELQRETPDGVDPLIYHTKDNSIHVQFIWDRGTGALTGGAYLIDDPSVMEKLLAGLRLGKPLLYQSSDMWMPSPDTVVTQTHNVLSFHWTATREGRIYELLYKMAAHIPIGDAWGPKE